MLKRRVALFSVAIVGITLLFGYQNFVTLPDGSSQCSDGTPAPQIGWGEFPKLFFTAAELGHGVACARGDLKLELIKTVAMLYQRNQSQGQRAEVVNLGADDNRFFELSSGSSVKLLSGANVAHPLNPGDARFAQRLAAAAFFVDATTATSYRALAKQILMHWSANTYRPSDMSGALSATVGNSESGLILGSSMVAFAAAYDLLAAGRVFTSSLERQQIEGWFSRVAQVIAVSNDAWMTNCALGAPFEYDGMSCERARGDNHVTVGASAYYVLGVMTNNVSMQDKALNNQTQYKWGYFDRLGYVIYNSNDKTAAPDRFPTVHTGEIYDRWRGHYRERTRGIHLHRSLSYPYLSLNFLTVQALAAKRQGRNLNQLVTKANGKQINLEKALLFYRLFLVNYNPQEQMDARSPRFSITSTANYMSLADTYCVNVFNPLPTDQNCTVERNKIFEIPQPPFASIDVAYTDAYYHLIYAGAIALVRGSDYERYYQQVVTPQKMSFATNTTSAHIIPFEPALFIYR